MMTNAYNHKEVYTLEKGENLSTLVPPSAVATELISQQFYLFGLSGRSDKCLDYFILVINKYFNMIDHETTYIFYILANTNKILSIRKKDRYTCSGLGVNIKHSVSIRHREWFVHIQLAVARTCLLGNDYNGRGSKIKIIAPLIHKSW